MKNFLEKNAGYIIGTLLAQLLLWYWYQQITRNIVVLIISVIVLYFISPFVDRVLGKK